MATPLFTEVTYRLSSLPEYIDRSWITSRSVRGGYSAMSSNGRARCDRPRRKSS